MNRASGWTWRFPALALLTGGFFVALTFTVGVALAWVSDRIGEWL